MLVLIRCDANPEIGTGHVMRCAALGMRLMKHGVKAHFVCIGLNENLGDWLCECGFTLTCLDAQEIRDWKDDLRAVCCVSQRVGPVDLLVVDHYGLDRQWEIGMREHSRRILVIDDIANRDHDCNILLDQNLRTDAHCRYNQRVPSGTLQFHGPQYALLRSEFDEQGLKRFRNGSVKKLLVFLGGTDPGNQTIKIIEALRRIGPDRFDTTVVLGPAYPFRDFIHASVVDLLSTVVLDKTDQMSKLISQSDLAIGTCGVAAWERCALGLPSLVVITAENQREDAEILHQLGAVENLGDADKVSVYGWEKALRQVIDNPIRLQKMQTAAYSVMAKRNTAITELENALLANLV